MKFIKKYKYLIFLFGLNVLLWTLAILLGTKIIHDNDGLVSVVFILFLPWFLVLPLDALYFSRLYPSKKRWISIVSGCITYISFLIWIDPGFMSIPGRESGLQQYQRMRIYPLSIGLINILYIAGVDFLLRYLGNNIYKK